MHRIVLTLMLTGVLGGMSADALAQEPTQVVSFHFASMRSARTGVAMMKNVRAVIGSVQVEAEEAQLSMSDGQLRLVLPGGGTVTLPQGHG